MHHTNPAAGMSPRAHRHALRKQQLAMACCLALAFPLAAQAQQAEAAPAEQSVETLDTVRVTGIRAAIATAVETKNESTSIVKWYLPKTSASCLTSASPTPFLACPA